MRKVRIGDEVTYCLWGSKENRTATVKDIEICKVGEKYGRSVSEVNIDVHYGVLDLSDDHWCFFDQVRTIKPKEN